MVDIVGIRSAFAGQELVPETVNKIRGLRELVEKRDMQLDIEIDGGVNRETIPSIVDAGVNVIIVGRQMLFHKRKEEYKEVITFLKELQCA